MRENFCNFHTVPVSHKVEKREILSHRKKIREMNSLVISLVKTLLSRNFCKKSVRENFRNFHTVYHTLWKLQKFALTKKIFRQINYLVISLGKTLLSRNFCQKWVRVNFSNTLCITTWKLFREIHSHTFFDKNFVKATFLLKSWFHEIFVRLERMSRFFLPSHCVCEETKNSLSFGKRFREINLQKSYFERWFYETFVQIQW